MKTIEEAAKEYASRENNDYTIETEMAFDAGVAFAQQWISVEEELPKHRSWVLVKTDLCNFPCQVCQVQIDRFVSTDNFIVLNITYWRPIERK